MSMPTISSPLANFLFDIANVVLSVGAAAVLLGTLGVVWMGSVKERYSDERIAANEAKAASANAEAERAREGASRADERAGEANKEAARGNERAGQLEKDAAEARERAAALEVRVGELNLEIARIKAPRTLDQEQKLSVASWAQAYPGTKFDLAYTYGDPETEDLILSIGGALIGGQWVMEDFSGNTMRYKAGNGKYVGTTSSKNVVIIIHSSSVETLKQPAESLTQALNAHGIKTILEIEDWKGLAEGGSDLDRGVIHIMAGRKID
ncbi:hypothetical protein [Methylobacterium sp. D48H]